MQFGFETTDAGTNTTSALIVDTPLDVRIVHLVLMMVPIWIMSLPPPPPSLKTTDNDSETDTYSSEEEIDEYLYYMNGDYRCGLLTLAVIY